MLDNEIEKLGIHELRTLARYFGVSSPTTKKKDELISLIKARKSGTLPPSTSKFGRPVKMHSNQNDLMVKLLICGDEELEEKVNLTRKKEEGIFVFNQDNVDPFHIPINYQMSQVAGVLRKTQKGTYYFLNYLKLSEKIYVVVDNADIEKYKLMVGDYILGLANFDSKQGFAYMRNFQEINNQHPTVNVLGEEKDLILPNTILDDSNIMMGQSKSIAVKNIDESINIIKEKAEKFIKKGYMCCVVGLDISIETKLKLDTVKGLIAITSTYEDIASISKEKVIDCHNFANSMFMHDKHVVVFVLETLQIFETLNIACKGDNEEINYLVKKTLAQSKASANSSISVYAMYLDNQQQDYYKEIRLINKITAN